MQRALSVPELMRLFRVSARKDLSQNFLFDRNVADKFVRVAGDLRRAHVIEVGPGPGTLTRSILDAGAHKLTVVEKDTRFIPFLQALAESESGGGGGAGGADEDNNTDDNNASSNAEGGRLDVRHGDILNFDYDDVLQTDGYGGEGLAGGGGGSSGNVAVKIIGNLPFGVATPLLFSYLRMLASRTGPFQHGDTELTLCFQKEVAERMVAAPDTKMRCRLSAMVQHYCRVRYAYELPRHVFVPAPKVDAAVVHLTPRAVWSDVSFNAMEHTAKLLFRGRRKMVRNTVKHLTDDQEDAAAILAAADIEPTVRPTSLSGEQIEAVAKQMELRWQANDSWPDKSK